MILAVAGKVSLVDLCVLEIHKNIQTDLWEQTIMKSLLLQSQGKPVVSEKMMLRVFWVLCQWYEFSSD